MQNKVLSTKYYQNTLEAAMEVFCKKDLLKKNSKSHRKIPALESLFRELCQKKRRKKKRLQEKCFPVKFATF